eukprot:7053090-Pyramimonas_sp.AAC.1
MLDLIAESRRARKAASAQADAGARGQPAQPEAADWPRLPQTVAGLIRQSASVHSPGPSLDD